jgi:hypothetical protein
VSAETAKEKIQMSSANGEDVAPTADAVIDAVLRATLKAMQTAEDALAPRKQSGAQTQVDAAQFIIDKAPALLAALQELRKLRK